MSSIVREVKKSILSIDDVIRLAHSTDVSSISSAHPNQPRDGEVYVYSKPALLEFCPSLDALKWIRRGGRNLVRKSDPVVSRSYFHEENGSGDASGCFTRIVYEVYTKPNPPMVVVHYRLRSSHPQGSSPSSGVKILTRSTTDDPDAAGKVTDDMNKPTGVLNKETNARQDTVSVFKFNINLIKY